tara:strand:- start:312 stop:620 length:309 start_codon:yes stop_codon:yes gene_type:complete
MAFKLNGWSAFTSKEERKVRKAKKKILKAGSKEKSGPGFLDESTGEIVYDGSNFGRKGKKAIKKLRKAGYTEEQIEEATGAAGHSVAMDWVSDPAVTKKDKK